MMEMPPLPEPDGTAAVVTDTQQLPNGLTGDVEEYVAAWSEPLVRAYGESCARMAREEERERCAKLAEMQGLAGHAISENTAAWCAAAIRSES